MIIESIEIEKFRAMKNVELKLGANITAIAGRNATMKSTLLGMLSQPFSISKGCPLFGEKTIDNYNFKSQFQEKFKLSDTHDIAGEHIWTLHFKDKSFYRDDLFTVISVKRKESGKKDSIRFINRLDGKTKGHGYVQLPVVFLSLSRIYPIGESGATKPLEINLTDEEEAIYLKWYKSILSLNDIKNASASVQKKDAKRVFAGVSDDNHDVFTSSAGEGNIGRILINVLSFKRLYEKYKGNYKGGILLIDELDATLYGYSQIKLIKFLKDVSEKYKIQIIFTTHSPIILKEVNRLQRDELIRKRIPSSCDTYKYDCEIIDLKPDYVGEERIVSGSNIHSSKELIKVIDDINLTATSISQSINVYLEDTRAMSLLKFILKRQNINYEQYINPIDINLGWTNYVQLYTKNIPEFRNSIIILDCDVQTKPEFKSKKKEIEEANNILFMPVDVEAGMYKMLRKHENYKTFEELLTRKNISMSYDVCFRDYIEDECKDSNEYKTWFKYVEESVGDEHIMFETWCVLNESDVKDFVEKFISTYNGLAERYELDYLIS